MAVQTAPAGHGHRSLLGLALQSRSRRNPVRLAALAKKIREHVLTVAALTAIDIGAFHVPHAWGTVAGWIMTGLSVLVLDFTMTEQ